MLKFKTEISNLQKSLKLFQLEITIFIGLTILSICQPIHAATSTVGPFFYSSWKSSDFKKPPFKTGVRSCAVLFGEAAPAKASLKEIQSKWPVMAREIKTKLFQTVSSQNPHKSHEVNLSKSKLSCSLCNGATAHLIQALDHAKIHLDVTPVITSYRIDAIEAKHIYLIAENYFGPGENLILDPTIRQFFSKPLANKEDQLSQSEINSKIPMLFLGTEADLRKLFEENYRPTEADPDQSWQDVVDHYLTTNIQTHFFNNDF